MDSQIASCPWEAIEDFRSLGEFERFEAWMLNQVAQDQAAELPVTHPYLDAPSFAEKWFEHLGSGEVWRLVWPDGPFTGLFERVDVSS
jgi:hypothetical protein